MNHRPFGAVTKATYFVLVVFSVAVTAIAAYLNHSFHTTQSEVLEASERVASQLDHLTRVEAAARALMAPGNDIFASLDVVAEQQRLRATREAFAQAVRVAAAGAGDDQRVLVTLRTAEGHAAAMVAAMDEIFRHFAAGDVDRAGVAMAQLDRRYGELLHDVSSAKQDLRNEQRRTFRAQSEHSSMISKMQSFSVALLTLLVAVLLAYGRRLRHEIVTSQERELYVQTLQEKEEELRIAIAERDRQTAELIHQKKFLSEAQRMASMGAWEWDITTGRISWSEELYELCRLDPAAVPPSYEVFLAGVAESDRERVDQRIRRAVEDHQPFEHEYQIILPGGDRRIHHTSIRLDVDEVGNPLRMFGVTRDVTDKTWAEEQLMLQEARLAEAQRVARIGSWELELETRTVTWSDALFEILGYASGEIVPSYNAYMSLIDRDEKRRVYSFVEDAIAKGERFEFEHMLRRRDGVEISIFVQAVVIRGADGRPRRVIGVSQDVTEQKKSEHALRLSEERFQLASCATHDVIWDRDLVNGTLWVNEGFATQFGHPAWGEIDLATWCESVHPDDKQLVVDSWRSAVEGDDTAWSAQYRFRAFDGTWRDVLDRGLLVRDETGRATRVIGALMDITDRRAVERMKDEFISTVSHELRTPLTSIRGALGLLSSGRIEVASDKGQRLLDIASSNTDRLVRLINDILDIERITSGKSPLNIVECEGGALVRTAVDVVRTLAEREGICITLGAGEVMLEADGDRIVQMLTNLLGNAVKFSPAGSHINVAVTAAGENAVFVVADEGRGIPAEKLESVFERFQQVDASDSRDKGGSGLGLTISRSIVEQHGGTIGVESELGRGTTFTVTIPMRKKDGSADGALPPKNGRKDVIHDAA